MLFRFVVFLLLLIFSNSFYLRAQAESSITFGLPFGENMVFQRDEEIRIFGRSKPKIKIEVSLADKKTSTETNNQGFWFVAFSPMKAGGPYQLKAKTDLQTIEIKKVYIGDVWLAAGQSNLVWFVDSATNAEKNIAEAINYKDKIFVFNLQLKPLEETLSPFTYLAKDWRNTDANTVRTFGAVPYAFAREIYQDQKIPIGIIQTAVSNTQIQSHMSKESLASYKDLEKLKADAAKDSIIWYKTSFYSKAVKTLTLCMDPAIQKEFTLFLNDRKLGKNPTAVECISYAGEGIDQNNELRVRIYSQKISEQKLKEVIAKLNKAKIIIADQEVKLTSWIPSPEISSSMPSSSFNSRVYPVTIYPIKGVIWYQGESNINDYAAYKELFTSLVKDWRKRWQRELPFITVQLHNFKTDHPENLLKFREVQSQLSKELNKVYIIDAFDLSDKDLDVHPKNKDPVGKRLAQMAKQEVYGKK